MAEHFIKKCIECGVIISQCRCPSKDKQVIDGICDKCRELQKVKDEAKYQ